jgi:hypothetical protein
MAQGDSSVMVGTDGDYLLHLKNYQITKIDAQNGLLRGKINSIARSQDGTKVGTDSLSYFSSDNVSFKRGYYEPYEYYDSNITDSLANNNQYYLLNNKLYYSNVGCKKKDNILKLVLYRDWNFYLPNLKLAAEEIPIKVESYASYGGAYRDFFLATSKRLIMLKDSGTWGTLRDSLFMNEPSYDIINDESCFLFTTKSGIYTYEFGNSSKFSKLYEGTETYQIASCDTNKLWISTNKGLIYAFFYKKRQLNQSGNVELCGKESLLRLTESSLNDSVCWYRNDTLVNATQSQDYYQNEGYNKIYAIVYKKNIGISDTTNVVTFSPYKGVSVDRYSCDTLVCKGGSAQLNLYCSNCSGNWFREGISTPIDTISTQDYYHNTSVSESGNYYAEVYNCNGYKTTLGKLTVKFIDQPKIEYSNPSGVPVCVGDTIKLKVNGAHIAYYYYSNNNDYFSSYSDNADSTFIATENGRYYINLYYPNIPNCLYSTNYSVNVSKLPYATVSQSGSSLVASPVVKNSEGITVLNSNVKNYQWYVNDKEIPGATDSIVSITKSGVYKAKLTNNYGCTNFSESYQAFATDINNNLIKSISYAPNPTNGKVFFSGELMAKVNKIDVFDNNGRLVKTQINNLSEIDLSEMTNGLYVVKLYTSDTNFTTKIILQK